MRYVSLRAESKFINTRIEFFSPPLNLLLLSSRLVHTHAQIKLILQIEDPRAKEKRAMGIEDESGVSRDEVRQKLSMWPILVNFCR